MDELLDRELIESLKSQIIDKIYEIKSIATQFENLMNEYSNNKNMASDAVEQLIEYRKAYVEEKEELAITFTGNMGKKRQESMQIFLEALDKRIREAETEIIPDIAKKIDVLETKKEYYNKKKIEIQKQLETYEVSNASAVELQTLLTTATTITKNGMTELKVYLVE